MKRTALKRKTPLRADPNKVRAWKQRTACKLKPGKKTKAWSNERIDLKEVFAAMGITSCELGRPGCWRDNALGFAHSLKRRNAITPALMREVCLACNPCHDVIEALPEADMAQIVRAIRAARPLP